MTFLNIVRVVNSIVTYIAFSKYQRSFNVQYIIMIILIIIVVICMLIVVAIVHVVINAVIYVQYLLRKVFFKAPQGFKNQAKIDKQTSLLSPRL